ncbi:Ferrochelatase, active site [Sesbania bispinosa]|nr:Ferrochelatase, active site [Sesbania bispinosa]
MNSPIRAPSSPSSSSCSCIRPPPCLTYASRNFKFPMLLPQAICTTQKMYRYSGGHAEVSANINPLKNCIVARCTPGWSEAQPFVSKQSHNRHLLPVEALVTSTAQDVSDTPLIGDDKIGVLLLNLGGPETLEDVQPFLFNLFADPAEELRKSLWEKNVPAKVYVGMRYWHPFTEEAIEQHTVIPSWYQREGYIKAMANLIEQELKGFDCPEEVMIFFSAHGVPLAYVEEAGDPYKAEMEECVDLIMEELERRKITNAYTLAYQSRVGPVEWLKPYTDDTIVELGKRGIKSLLAVPISFVSEHIETLEEIDVEYKELALKSGIEKWGRVPALGCEPTFISDLADAVIESLPYVGAMAVSNLEARQSLVPLGSVEELLAAYDSQRRELPPPVLVWEWGWTKSAETWNGRAAMLAVLLLLFLEVTTGEGFLHQWGILPLFR